MEGIFGLYHVLLVVSVGQIFQKYEANDLKMLKEWYKKLNMIRIKILWEKTNLDMKTLWEQGPILRFCVWNRNYNEMGLWWMNLF